MRSSWTGLRVCLCVRARVCVHPGHTGTRLVGRRRGVRAELPNLLALNRRALAKQAGPE